MAYINSEMEEVKGKVINFVFFHVLEMLKAKGQFRSIETVFTISRNDEFKLSLYES